VRDGRNHLLQSFCQLDSLTCLRTDVGVMRDGKDREECRLGVVEGNVALPGLSGGKRREGGS